MHLPLPTSLLSLTDLLVFPLLLSCWYPTNLLSSLFLPYSQPTHASHGEIKLTMMRSLGILSGSQQPAVRECRYQAISLTLSPLVQTQKGRGKKKQWCHDHQKFRSSHPSLRCGYCFRLWSNHINPQNCWTFRKPLILKDMAPLMKETNESYHQQQYHSCIARFCIKTST